jgi:hypothetical protein
VGIKHQRRWGLTDRLDHGIRYHLSGLEAVDIPPEARHAVRWDSARVGRHQHIGRHIRVAWHQTEALEYTTTEANQHPTLNAHCVIHHLNTSRRLS